jgi:hypothetical protein
LAWHYSDTERGSIGTDRNISSPSGVANETQLASGATEYWAWGIDNVIPMAETDTLGIGKG